MKNMSDVSTFKSFDQHEQEVINADRKINHMST